MITYWQNVYDLKMGELKHWQGAHYYSIKEAERNKSKFHKLLYRIKVTVREVGYDKSSN